LINVLNRKDVNISSLFDSHSFLEGDYIETNEGLFFAVKGNYHPGDRVLSILRYIPDETGDRIKNDIKYKRVYDLKYTGKYLKRNYPHYLSYIEELDLTLQSVPIQNIKNLYNPREKIKEIINISYEPSITLRKFVNAIIEESGVSIDSFGISGSLLIGLHKPESDIDLNVYGRKDGIKVYDALKKLRQKNNWINSYDTDTIRKVLESRWRDTGINLDIFLDIEIKKVLHGLIDGREYFVRLLNPTPIEYKSRPINVVTIRRIIEDDSESIFTPCRYSFDNSDEEEIRGVLSYRGKFTEQVKKGELVEARGMLEEVWKENKREYRLVLGRKGDYLLPVYLLK